ncbi:MAG TPA: putative beta-lysine N-acetyltransferase [Anaerolineae bacterium]|jgi:putative beta-lysine N-acetyltransferase|nr:putative beta-lysine N-acetyltransferase [Anaerolineae bacterium]
MVDVITRLGKSVIQHGEHNNRIYLMRLATEDFPAIIGRLDDLAILKGYSKIFAKVPGFAKDEFEESGYVTEAHIPGFFNGNEDAYLMGKYLSSQRWRICGEDQLDEVIILARFKAAGGMPTVLPDGYRFRMPGKSDVVQMANVYKQVFQTYPFPVHDPRHLYKTMDENVVYFAVYKGDNIVALSSTEIDVESKSAEMTDFATLPEYRGKGFAAYLLQKMEGTVREKEIKTAYTIARASSHGINIAFAKMGYQYGGMLVNNTNICGNLESMNVWYKHLRSSPESSRK